MASQAVPSSPSGGTLARAHTIRRGLYSFTFGFAALVALIEPQAKSLAVAAVMVVGLFLIFLPIPSSRARAAILFAYELLAAFMVTLAGQPLLGILVLVASSGANALVRGLRRPVIGLAALAGSGLTLTSVLVLGMDSMMPFFDAGPTMHDVGVVLGVALSGALAGGVAWLFAALGEELDARGRELREWPRRLRDLLDRDPEAVLVHGGDRILYANAAAASLLGTETSALLESTSLTAFLQGEARARLGIGLARTIGGEHLPTAIWHLKAVDGGTKEVEIWGQRIDWDGQVAVQLHLKDRTEFERTRRELEALFDRLPVALYRSLPSGEVIAANPALAGLLGYSAVDEMMNDPDVTTRAYPDATRRVLWRQRIEADGEVLGFEQDMVRRDGSRIRVSDSARAIRDVDGSVLYYEGALVDVTGRWEAERSRRRLSQILATTSDFVALGDSRRGVRYANPALRRFLGLPEGGPLPHLRVHDMMAEGQDAVIREATAKALRVGSWRGEVRLVGGGGREALVSAVLQHHPDEDEGRFYSLVGRDVSEERRTAAALAELVRAKDQFVASVSHELRTPLTAAVGIAQELRDGLDSFEPVEVRELVTLISEQSQEVADIVEDLLVAARIDTDSVVLIEELIDLEECVATVLRGMPRSQKSIVVSVSGKVRADGKRVRQILRNLVTNALRYGGDRVEIASRCVDRTCRIEVLDDGAGMSVEEWERIFEPFQRAHGHDEVNSVGLGLTVSRWLARKMDGDLSYSYDGRSCFRLSLPSG